MRIAICLSALLATSTWLGSSASAAKEYKCTITHQGASIPFTIPFSQFGETLVTVTPERRVRCVSTIPADGSIGCTFQDQGGLVDHAYWDIGGGVTRSAAASFSVTAFSAVDADVVECVTDEPDASASPAPYQCHSWHYDAVWTQLASTLDAGADVIREVQLVDDHVIRLAVNSASGRFTFTHLVRDPLGTERKIIEFSEPLFSGYSGLYSNGPGIAGLIASCDSF